MNYNHPNLMNCSLMSPAVPPAYFINGQTAPHGLLYVDPIEFMKTYVSCCKEMYQLGVEVGKYAASTTIENQQEKIEISADNYNGTLKGA